MQSTHKISGDAAGGFATYLTDSRGRGDCYVGGEADGETGRWQGSPEALRTLGLEPGGRVEREALVALMEGRDPRSGVAIRRAGGDGSRVAGVDMTFSAPKSVSALWAVSGPYRRAQIEAAHRGAVGSAMARVERDVEMVRRREAGVLRWEPARSLVRAEFVHTSSRLTRGQERQGVPDPQLHPHVVVVAAERGDGRFAAVDSRELFRSARVNGAWYRAELAYSLGELGLHVRGGRGKDGRCFEVEGGPRRSREALVGADRGDRSGGADLPRAVRPRAAWRRARGDDGRNAGDEDRAGASRRRPGVARGRRGVWARPAAGGGVVRRSRPSRDAGRWRESARGAGRYRSTVERRELEARAAELSAGAMRPEEARHVVAELISAGELVELEGNRRTSRELRELELRTLDCVTDLVNGDTAGTSEAGLAVGRESARRQLGLPLTREQQAALATVTGAGDVAVLVGQAGTGKGVVIGAARAAWERDGRRVIGTAVAGATAKRLGANAGIAETMTMDALTTRHRSGRLGLDGRSVIVVDEAGMADTRRLAEVRRSAPAACSPSTCRPRS